MSRPVYSSTVVVRARELREAGWTYRRITELLERELGHRVHPRTVQLWCDDEIAERRRRADRELRRRNRSAAYSFRLTGSTPEYRAAFARRLHDDGVPVQSIATVLNRVSPCPSGRLWTRDRVYWLLGDTAYQRRHGERVA